MVFPYSKSKPECHGRRGSQAQRHIRRRTGNRLRAYGILVIALLAAACQTHSQPPSVVDKGIDLVWPQPPASARVRYRFDVRSPVDFGIRPNLLQRFLNWVSGREVPRLVRPHGLSTDPDGRLWVTDPGARLIHIFDPKKMNHRSLPRRGDAPLVSPIAIAHDSKGVAYVTDSALAVIRRFDRNGAFVWQSTKERPLLFRQAYIVRLRSPLTCLNSRKCSEVICYQSSPASVEWSVLALIPGGFSLEIAILRLKKVPIML